jgi:hypothetical protein
MSADNASMPYSRKNLEALASVLKIHRALVWIDPATNNISVKQLGGFENQNPQWVQRGE